MKNLYVIIVLIAMAVTACKTNKKETEMANPLLEKFDTPFEVPPFQDIQKEHFVPAVETAIEMHNEEIEKIVNEPAPPDFNNTIVAMERAGSELDQVTSVFYNLNSSLTGPEMQEIAKTLSPLLSSHSDEIKLNSELFSRVKTVYSEIDDLNLNTEDKMLLEETYKYFVRGGANLEPAKKEELRTINEELSILSLQFGQNVLKEINNYKLVIEDKQDLNGLPENVISSAAELASEMDEDGKWVFTVQKPSLLPFLTYSEQRDLREELFNAYINLGNNDNEYDNKEILKKMVSLRATKSQLLGYENHADYVLEENMAKEAGNVYDFLMNLWEPGLRTAQQEAADMQDLINAEGGDFNLKPWDWWFYAEKVRKNKYDLDEETLSQYFVLENVREGAFNVAKKLFGLSFEERNDIPKYHEDVQSFEVKDADGSHLGILYMDFFPRSSKRSGAWMSEYRGQKKIEGKDIRPVVTTNFNFTKPTGDIPSLLTMDEVLTTFHEFGHALHGLLSTCTYGSLSGTSVPRDFVELPSQIMENWAMEPEVLRMYAKHYETGDIIPDELIEKIHNSQYFNQGFATTEYLAASFLDMDYHTLKPEETDINVTAFENSSMKKIGLIPEIVSRYRSTYFNHIFSGGYSSGYYSYIWAARLDTDAFQAFVETGDLFDKETANAFRTQILEKGGTKDPMELYVAFRGKEPGIEALLKKRGLDR